jgi:hypothetical protein
MSARTVKPAPQATLAPANDASATPKLPPIRSWRAAQRWYASLPCAGSLDARAQRDRLLDFFVYWSTNGLLDYKTDELREWVLELMREGCKPARPADFDRECRERMKEEKFATDPDPDLFDLRPDLEGFFLGGEPHCP